MRCQDSGAVAPPRGRVVTIDARHRELRTCGCCGKLVRIELDGPPGLRATVTERLAVHGNREPCPICGSRSWQHAPSDHPAGCLTETEHARMRERLLGRGESP